FRFGERDFLASCVFLWYLLYRKLYGGLCMTKKSTDKKLLIKISVVVVFGLLLFDAIIIWALMQ
ncbi:hypothetical protein KKC_16017, partial [Listeria fleischmannii subsp. coloradonensis]